MVTIRGWLKGDYRTCSGYRVNEITLPSCPSESLYGVHLTTEAVSGRTWFTDESTDFLVKPELAAQVEEWTLMDQYNNPGMGLFERVYAPSKEGISGEAHLRPVRGDATRAVLTITGCKTIEDLKALYLEVQRGQAKLLEVWDGQPKQAEPACDYKARAEKAEKELDDCKVKLGSCEMSLRSLRGSTARMVRVIWSNMRCVPWWSSKRALRSAVRAAMLSESEAFRCANDSVEADAIETFFK